MKDMLTLKEKAKALSAHKGQRRFKNWRIWRRTLFQQEIVRIGLEAPNVKAVMVLARAEGITPRLVYQVLAGER